MLAVESRPSYTMVLHGTLGSQPWTPPKDWTPALFMAAVTTCAPSAFSLAHGRMGWNEGVELTLSTVKDSRAAPEANWAAEDWSVASWGRWSIMYSGTVTPLMATVEDART